MVVVVVDDVDGDDVEATLDGTGQDIADTSAWTVDEQVSASGALLKGDFETLGASTSINERSNSSPKVFLEAMPTVPIN